MDEIDEQTAMSELRIQWAKKQMRELEEERDEIKSDQGYALEEYNHLKGTIDELPEGAIPNDLYCMGCGRYLDWPESEEKPRCKDCDDFHYHEDTEIMSIHAALKHFKSKIDQAEELLEDLDEREGEILYGLTKYERSRLYMSDANDRDVDFF